MVVHLAQNHPFMHVNTTISSCFKIGTRHATREDKGSLENTKNGKPDVSLELHFGHKKTRKCIGIFYAEPPLPTTTTTGGFSACDSVF